MQLKYVDLYLVHQPLSLEYGEEKFPLDKNNKLRYERGFGMQDTWRAMEKLVDEGLAKRIGISNFSVQLIYDMLKYCRIKPYNHQTEIQPYL